jgi:(E)-4-hydroxy-3-methylbut-2-enyl-diphosphate synthase
MEITYPRRRTRAVRVGDALIGGEAPILVQSMITEETRNVDACVAQIIRMYEAGCELVRVTTPTMAEAHCLGEIRARLDARGYRIPLVADVHHQGTDIAVTVAQFVDKVRINPGLFVYRRPRGRSEEYSPEEHAAELDAIEQSLAPVIEACKGRNIAMRIGVNHGSLAERMLVTWGDTPRGMVESAVEYLRICEKYSYRNLVLSLKASRVPVMIAANRLMAQRMDAEGMDYPLHLGVTEAGDGQYARVKSTTGIGTLLAEGIGDTIRVSLAEDPINELPVCYEILQALGLRRTQVEYVACPGCGRTKFDLPTVLNEVRAATRHLVGLNIAVMGCFPPGERVVTTEGFAAIDTLQEGTQVLTDTGQFAPVTAMQRHEFHGDVVEIKPRGAPSVRMTPNHPVSAIVRNGREKGGRRWENIEYVVTNGHTPRWYAADAINRDFVLLYPILRGEHVVEHMPEAPELAVDEDLLTIAACYVAEGSAGGSKDAPYQLFFTFGIHETALTERVTAIVRHWGVPASVRERPTRHNREVIVSSRALSSLFVRVFGRRAENKRLPQWMLFLPKRQQAMLLKALWQCDGYVGEVRGYPRATYVTVSSTLAIQVHQLLLRQGIAASILERRPADRQTAYYVSVTSADGLRRFAEQLGITLNLPDGRYRTGRMGIDERYLYLPVQSVRTVPYHGPVYNIEVARAHTYVSSLCLVHNCIVNGPGEMADADYGYVGKAGGKIALYRGREVVKESVPQEAGVVELISLLKSDGKWVEPEGTGDREQGTGDREQGTGNRGQGTEGPGASANLGRGKSEGVIPLKVL